MAIAASGAVSLADFRTEFVGGSSAISLGDLYRGGSHIRAKAGNNTSTNLAASVPTSGTIDFNDFYSTAKGFRKTYTSGATNQDASSVFGSDYGVNYPKEIVINSGVELGATSTGQEALQINSGLSGSMTVTNNGTISGAGGSANGGSGGDAFEANASCTLINNGTIRAGGGGGGSGGSGGSGGTGGQGQTSSTGWGNQEGPYGWQGYAGASAPGGNPKSYYLLYNGNANSWSWVWRPGGGYTAFATGLSTYKYYGAHRYTYHGMWANSWPSQYYYISRMSQVTNYTYYNGGSGGGGGGGGNGGVGQGYNQVRGGGHGGSGGSSGSSGGTNAGSGGNGGTGGTGGDGGLFGAAGSTGNTGATGNTGGNGNYTNGSGGSGGSSGSGGGAAGKYLRGSSNVTFTNNGTVQGGTA